MIDKSDLESLLICQNCGNVFSQIHTTYCPACEDWPEGAAARPNPPLSVRTSASTVGLPRESRMRRSETDWIRLIHPPGCAVRVEP